MVDVPTLAEVKNLNPKQLLLKMKKAFDFSENWYS